GFEESLRQLIVTEPLGYIDFLALTSHARLILTDSGGLQEESTALGIPCLTLRENTERPVTVTHGTNQVVGTETQAILDGLAAVLRPAVGAQPDRGAVCCGLSGGARRDDPRRRGRVPPRVRSAGLGTDTARHAAAVA